MIVPLMDDLAAMLLKLSDGLFDPIAKESVRKWSAPPKAAEVLRTLDLCASGSLCSDFEMLAMDALFMSAVDREGTTREAVYALADQTWRRGP